MTGVDEIGTAANAASGIAAGAENGDIAGGVNSGISGVANFVPGPAGDGM